MSPGLVNSTIFWKKNHTNSAQNFSKYQREEKNTQFSRNARKGKIIMIADWLLESKADGMERALNLKEQEGTFLNAENILPHDFSS